MRDNTAAMVVSRLKANGGRVTEACLRFQARPGIGRFFRLSFSGNAKIDEELVVQVKQDGRRVCSFVVELQRRRDRCEISPDVWGQLDDEERAVITQALGPVDEAPLSLWANLVLFCLV